MIVDREYEIQMLSKSNKKYVMSKKKKRKNDQQEKWVIFSSCEASIPPPQ